MSTAYSGDGITFPDNSVQATAPRVGMVNRIINGDMRIDQRNAGAAVTTAGSFPVDRMRMTNITDGAFSAQQDSSSPVGFTNSVKVTTTTADGTLTTTQSLLLEQRLEGGNTYDLAWGTANAKTVTLSFWVRSSLTGTFGGALQNSVQNRSYPFIYSILVADTWEYKTVTVAGDTTGTWLTTTGIGLRLAFGLGIGPDRSGAAGAWNSNNNFSATGATSVVGTLNATWYITGVQLEKGSTATDFEYVDYSRQLQMCQRYYSKLTSFISVGLLGVGISSGTTSSWVKVTTPVALRALPTVNYFNLSMSDQATYSAAVSSIAGAAQTLTGGGVAFNHAGGATLYRTAVVNTTSISGYIDFSAEL